LINRLVEGNANFRRDVDGAMLARAGKGQTPSVAILSCSDSRVIPELIFGFPMGDAFVVRVAGNSCSDPAVLGSLEYAVDHLHVRAIIVLGHTNCGAVAAALAGVRPENLSGVMRDIERAMAMIGSGHPADGDAIAESNVRLQLRSIKDKSPAIMTAVSEGKLTLIGALYDVAVGTVSILNGTHGRGTVR